MSATPPSTSHGSPAEADPRFFQAVQYVLGELSAAEQDAFEAALAEDASLCILVAEASQLLSGVQIALAESTPAMIPQPLRISAQKRDGWTAAALVAAASGMAAALLATFTVPSSSTFAARSSQAVQLVSLWRDAGRTESGFSAGDSSFDAEAASQSPDDRVPLWMLAAVSLEERRVRSPLHESSEPWEDN